MINPDKNFKLSRAAKTLIALMCKSDPERHAYKAALIQSELSAESARRQSLKSKGTKSRNVISEE